MSETEIDRKKYIVCCPLCDNGRPFTKADYERFKEECDQVDTFVLD